MSQSLKMEILAALPPPSEVEKASSRFLPPAQIKRADEKTQRRFLEFFAATIRNKNTREAYYRGFPAPSRDCVNRGLWSKALWKRRPKKNETPSRETEKPAAIAAF